MADSTSLNQPPSCGFSFGSTDSHQSFPWLRVTAPSAKANVTFADETSSRVSDDGLTRQRGFRLASRLEEQSLNGKSRCRREKLSSEDVSLFRHAFLLTEKSGRSEIWLNRRGIKVSLKLRALSPVFYLSITVIALFPLLSSSVRAQANPGVVGSSMGDDSDHSSVLGAGDVLSLSVMDMPEVSQSAIHVETDGTIHLPLIGTIQASGLTLARLRAELSVKLSKYVNDPQISISLAQNGSRFVSVLGEVNSPGVRTLDGDRSLVQMLSLAGGVKADAGPNVIVTRQISQGPFPSAIAGQITSDGFVRVTLPLDGLLASNAPADNFSMRPGDTISVPKEQLVYVVGDVHRAGGFPLSSHQSMSVLQALALAEGSGPSAALKGTKILRPQPGGDGTPTQIPIDLQGILAGKSPDRPLYANDVLFVPKSAAKSGAVRAADVMLQVATGVAIYR